MDEPQPRIDSRRCDHSWASSRPEGGLATQGG